ncbi:phasin family protein [Pelagibius litoralis]|uniref:Phasin family protein n=1 Tax=Pelagibius litoralis TaxID=374515 RepID=A0A967KG89_9PROT|nr:phasin family protein [Pelagibius litoralis]NIA71925.1 phasin family protein [Pelagibius litoralis]
MAVSGNPFLTGDFAKFDFASMMDPSKLAEQWEKIDFTAVPEQFKVPGVDAQALVDAQKRNIEAFASANKIALEGAQAVVRRQAEILRQGIEDASKAFGELNAAGTPQDKLAKQAELMKSAYEASLGNLRELTEMATKSNGEAAELLTTRVSESFSELTGEVKKAAKKK